MTWEITRRKISQPSYSFSSQGIIAVSVALNLLLYPAIANVGEETNGETENIIANFNWQSYEGNMAAK